jgi:L-fuconolactonase
MVIIDAQVHVWGPDTPERPWSPDGAANAHRSVPLGKDELLREMDAAGVDRVVIVPPSWEGDRNDLALEAARLHPDRFGIMGRLPIEKPESRGLVDGWRQRPGMLGVRLTFHRGAYRSWPTDGTGDWFWAAAERARVPAVVFAPGQVPQLGEIAARHPGLRLVLDHLALSTEKRDDALGPALEPVLAASRHPNIAVKASAMPCYTTEGHPFRNLHWHTRRVVDAYGPRRVFWGTDLTRLRCPYRHAVTPFTEELDSLSSDDKEWIMGRGIAEWLGWPRPRN